MITDPAQFSNNLWINNPGDPAGGSPFVDEDFEFVEIENVGTEVIDLSYVQLLGGIQFDFSQGDVAFLEPGEYVLVVEDLEAFSTRYDTTGMLIAGQYSGRLGNRAEDLVVMGVLDTTVLDFFYEDHWYPETDGLGTSLVLADAALPNESLSQPERWFASSVSGGSPGGPDPGPPGGGRQIPGDVNQDAELDILDAMAILFSLFVGPAVMPLPCAGATITDGGNLVLSDVDGSQVVDLNDAVYLLLYLYRAAVAPVLGTQCTPIEGCPSVCLSAVTSRAGIRLQARIASPLIPGGRFRIIRPDALMNKRHRDSARKERGLAHVDTSSRDHRRRSYHRPSRVGVQGLPQGGDPCGM